MCSSTSPDMRRDSFTPAQPQREILFRDRFHAHSLDVPWRQQDYGTGHVRTCHIWLPGCVQVHILNPPPPPDKSPSGQILQHGCVCACVWVDVCVCVRGGGVKLWVKMQPWSLAARVCANALKPTPPLRQVTQRSDMAAYGSLWSGCCWVWVSHVILWADFFCFSVLQRVAVRAQRNGVSCSVLHCVPESCRVAKWKICVALCWNV